MRSVTICDGITHDGPDKDIIYDPVWLQPVVGSRLPNIPCKMDTDAPVVGKDKGDSAVAAAQVGKVAKAGNRLGRVRHDVV